LFFLRRCVKLGREDTCVDVVQKKRGWRKGKSRSQVREEKRLKQQLQGLWVPDLVHEQTLSETPEIHRSPGSPSNDRSSEAGFQVVEDSPASSKEEEPDCKYHHHEDHDHEEHEDDEHHQPQEPREPREPYGLQESQYYQELYEPNMQVQDPCLAAPALTPYTQAPCPNEALQASTFTVPNLALCLRFSFIFFPFIYFRDQFAKNILFHFFFLALKSHSLSWIRLPTSLSVTPNPKLSITASSILSTPMTSS